MIMSIGADIEFEVIKQGRIIEADSIFYPEECDGSGLQLEIRIDPVYINSIEDLNYKTILNIMNNFKKELKRYRKYHLNYYQNIYPCGAHIHFATEEEIFKKILDAHSMIIEPKFFDVFFPYCRYNYCGLGLFRRKNNIDGRFHVEIRTPSNWVFSSPLNCIIYFTILFQVIHDILQDKLEPEKYVKYFSNFKILEKPKESNVIKEWGV